MAISGLLLFDVELTPDTALDLYNWIDGFNDTLSIAGIVQTVLGIGTAVVSRFRDINTGLTPDNIVMLLAAIGIGGITSEAVASAMLVTGVVVAVMGLAVTISAFELGNINDMLVNSGALTQNSVLSVSTVGVGVIYTLSTANEHRELEQSKTYGITTLSPILLFYWASTQLPGSWK